MAKNDSQVMSARRRRQPLTVGDIRHWIRDSRNELRKVTWPTWDQTRNLTLVVLAVCIIMAAFLGAVDFILGNLIRFIVGY